MFNPFGGDRMFHGSIRPDPDFPSAAVRLRAAEAGTRTAADTLRAEGLCLTAPWVGGLSVACALAVLWSLGEQLSPVPLALWAGLVVATNWVTVRARRRAAGWGGSRLLRSTWWAVAEAAIHAGLWTALPAFSFQHQDTTTQIVLTAAICTMMAGAVLHAIVPVAAVAWAAILGAALVWALHNAPGGIPAGLALLAPIYLIVILVGCLAVERLLSKHLDIAAQERASRESIGLLLKEYEDQGVGWLWQIDAANLLTYVSPRICVLLGRSTSQLIGQSLPVVLGCDPRLGGSIVAREAFNQLEIEVDTPAGPRCVALSGTPIVAAEGGYQGFRGVGTDVTEIRRSQERLTQLASIDMLTGLPNRQRMREIFADAIGRAERGSDACALMFLDLDGFKPVNDTFGHSIGDSVLRTVAQRLQAEVGTAGLIGRVGGDEFALLLHDGSSRKGVEALGRRLIAAIAEPFAFDKGEIRVGISVGCAFAPVDGATTDDLLLKADLALYEAKSQGRGAFCLFDARMQRDAEARLKLEQDLRKALERKQLRIAYQPIVSAETQDVLGFEALLRWQHPERGLVSPTEFVPLAEETGLIARIGAWVLEQATRDAADWPDHMFVSVNVSPRQLLEPGLPHVVGEALTHARLQPNRLELEVTESVFMSDSDGSLDVLRRLRTLGVGIALDDFGTGYSSLGYLNRTIFHTLKIDGSFVRDAAHKPETNAIIGTIVDLANKFRMAITAEGIETAADFERMRNFGCHKLQGYLFGKPMWHAETLALVGTRYDPRRRSAA